MCLRSRECDDLHGFERHLAAVCAECQYDFGGMGAVGFLYQSAKDSLMWNNLSPQRWISIVMDVGRYIVMDDEAFRKSGTNKKQSDGDIAAMLKAAFGDGK